MSESCPRRAQCPKTRLSKLQALIAENGALATTLQSPALRVMERLTDCDVLSVTTNTTAVLTSMGRHGRAQGVGTPLVPERDRSSLRIDPHSIGSVLAVERIASCRKPYSLHVFDRDGAMLYEAYLTNLDDELDIHPLVSGDHDEEAGPAPMPAARSGRAAWMPRQVVAAPGTRDAAYHFDSILGDNGISRRASLPTWGDAFAWQISPTRLIDFFAFMCDIRMPAAIAVGNAGLIHCHQGALDGLKASSKMLRVSSRSSNVTISLSDIEDVWVCRVAGRHGPEYLLEIYDWRYHCVAQFKASAQVEPLLGDVWRRQLSAIPRRCI